jgi:hypothetical protein
MFIIIAVLFAIIILVAIIVPAIEDGWMKISRGGSDG